MMKKYGPCIGGILFGLIQHCYVVGSEEGD